MHTPFFPRSVATGAAALALTLAFVSLAGAQVIRQPVQDLPAVQETDLGPDARPPYDGTVEVALSPSARKALAEGGGWEALENGLRLAYDGERSLEAAVRVALVTRDGRVLESRRLQPTTLKRGAPALPGGSIAFPAAGKLAPAAAFFPSETYFPDNQWFPSETYFPDNQWDARHTVTTPENTDGKRTIKVDGMPGSGSDDAKLRKRPGRTTYVGEHGIVGEHGSETPFLLVTVVPTDPDAQGQIEVRPLVVDLDARGQTGNPLLAPDDKPDW